MEKSDIRKILKNPDMDLVEKALSYVNLSDMEKDILIKVEIQGKTEEKASEIIGISTRYLQTIKAQAFEKLNIVWSYNRFIALMLKEWV
jgi:DNA-directed RNA polymerase specialized sigma subunit